VWPSRCQRGGLHRSSGNYQGRAAVEEFLACGIWPLNEGWEFEVETRESPLSMVVVPMPKVTSTIKKQESWVAFKARIVVVEN
jgi:hypothetical protein